MYKMQYNLLAVSSSCIHDWKCLLRDISHSIFNFGLRQLRNSLEIPRATRKIRHDEDYEKFSGVLGNFHFY